LCCIQHTAADTSGQPIQVSRTLRGRTEYELAFAARSVTTTVNQTQGGPFNTLIGCNFPGPRRGTD
jgi:hypothetical protein